MEARRIVVTGVGRGLGRRLAELFVANGDQVWGTSRSGDVPDGLAGCVPLELRNEQSIIDAVTSIGQQTDRIDVLINCAGLNGNSFGASDEDLGPLDVDADVFNAVFEANATGPMLVTKQALPMLKAGVDALVVNISSQLGSMQAAVDMGDDTAYCVSKAALNMLSVKTAAALRPDGIAVVMMHPGWVATDMGGSDADLSIDESCTAMVDTINQLTIGDSGRFIQYDGQDHPW